MKVLKFGGTSVGSIENLRRVKDIIHRQDGDVVVIVSAFGGVTDQVLNMARTAEATRTFDVNEMMEITTRHMTTIDILLPEAEKEPVKQKVQTCLNELENLIKGVSMIGELTNKTLDRIGGIGELLSSTIIASFLNARWVDSRDLIVTDNNFVKAEVAFEATNQRIVDAFNGFSGIAVAPGFVSKSNHGEPTTLGRGGSDYSAALYAAALNAESLEIWTDVNGFMTADPRVISKAYTIDYLTYAEAMELSHFGAKVIYPPTILPVYRKRIPVRIKNTSEPDADGTLIGYEKLAGQERIIKGISSISGITLLTLHGAGMVGVTGISMRMFTALAKEKINVILISQASSENSISVAVSTGEAIKAQEAVENEFQHEIAKGYVNGVIPENGLSIVAIVGENMKESAGIAGKLFNTLGKNGVNIRAIAQGASELNISWVVRTDDLRKTLNVVHEAFFLTSYKELNLFLIGVGTVGGIFLEQLKNQQEKLFNEQRLKLKLVGVANSKKMLFNREGIDPGNFAELLKESSSKSGFDTFTDQMIEMNMFNSVFVDCTANEELANYYHKILDARISVVAANKVAASSVYSNYKMLKDSAVRKGIKFFFETNVGAGLPIISTIKDLINSGDKIIKIQAVLSGTLNFIFNTLGSDVPLSKAIEMARDAGYSEPDPRVDLSGKDVVRKLLILSREAGYPLEESDVKVQKFIPESLFSGSMNDFWVGVKALDESFELKRKELAANKQKWRFIATFEPQNSKVELQTVSQNSPFFDLEGSNNIILLTTERYKEYPLQIKGYGAGAAVTAAGVFADIIRIANI
ncbi:MAG: bifunctional aspartate kinase/homoserine dehydrogenase I [Prolixibacteraceae bacterium]|nr:bifunctional aspartate kinase/homoserine dehydrogenase I [Prolixibacteraceae bacterium]MBN2650237.1 bifunctional aspartate kinase/homoserine dehydrogenase I [Prolixibacteraceae bacterium]